ncbi:MAG: beta-propeller fold lactonase family protein, partial [Candidatus Latescibacterota bacterium]
MHYRSSLALSDRIPMRSAGENLFAANIPGQPVSAQVEYRIEARNDSIDQIFYPENERWFSFDILELSGAPLAFTALRGSDFISVVDTDTRAEQARIAVGDEPIQIIAGPAGHFLYVSNLSSNEISVISAATFQEVERIETAVQPLDMAISPNGSTLYATNSGAGTLTIIDLETRSARTAWLVGLSTGPYGIAARNDKVFATDLTNDQLLIMDSEGIIQSRIDVAPQPRSLALSPDGKLLYITSMGENVLTVIDAETDQIDGRARLPVSGTFAVAVHPTGEKVYLTAHDEGSVLILKADDLSIQAQIATGDNPRGIAFTPDGQTAFVTNAFSDETVLIDATTDRLVGRYRSGDEPRGIVVNNPVQLSQDTSVYEMG